MDNTNTNALDRDSNPVPLDSEHYNYMLFILCENINRPMQLMQNKKMIR